MASAPVIDSTALFNTCAAMAMLALCSEHLQMIVDRPIRSIRHLCDDQNGLWIIIKSYYPLSSLKNNILIFLSLIPTFSLCEKYFFKQSTDSFIP